MSEVKSFEDFFRYVRTEEWRMSNGLPPTLGWMRGYFDRYFGLKSGSYLPDNNLYPQQSLAWNHYIAGWKEASEDYSDEKNDLFVASN